MLHTQTSTAAERLGLREAGWLGLVCLVLFGIALVQDRTLTIHETVHCQNVREMLAGGDWIIPTYGGRPWLERPPIPHWATAAVVWLTGAPAAAWGYRLSAVLAAYLVVLLTGWVASVWYGRRFGLLSGIVLATMMEFNAYASGPECDIFLCLIVTTAVALVVRLEFLEQDDERRGFLGGRSWAVLAFFVLAGLANVAKGLIFGDLFIFSTLIGFLICTADLRGARRYVWLWGWLAFAVAAGTWAVTAYLRHPDVVDLWFSDYAGRFNTDYMREPRYYYLMQLPRVLLPWTIPALVGLVVAGRAAWSGERRERFLFVWAVLPIAVLSACSGKHHHYLLHGMAPWAVLGALGGKRVWEFLSREAPVWLRHPAVALIALALPVNAAIWLMRSRIPGPEWLPLTAMVAWTVIACVSWWVTSRANARLAAGVVCGFVIVGHLAGYLYHTAWNDRYLDDRAFVGRVRERVPADADVLVVNDISPLYGSWFLFYLDRPAILLHNTTFLRSDRLPEREAYIIARAQDRRALGRFGEVVQLDQSVRTRAESSSKERWTLFHLRFRDDLKRLPGDVRISPMQATGRAKGPYLTEDLVAQQSR